MQIQQAAGQLIPAVGKSAVVAAAAHGAGQVAVQQAARELGRRRRDDLQGTARSGGLVIHQHATVEHDLRAGDEHRPAAGGLAMVDHDLVDQGRQVSEARRDLELDIAAAWNTYETVRVSGELVGLVRSSRRLLDGLLNRQVPAMKPFRKT